MIYVLGSGTGGELTVNAPAGVTVIAVNNSTNKTYSKVADASGIAVFKSLPEATYSVHITDGQQSTDPIQVSVQYKASASITWFSATINVTYPAGSTCTCSNGSTVYTAGNTSGSWTFTVPRAGTWTVTSTNGSQTKSQAVSITYSGQVASVGLSYELYLFNNGDQCTGVTGGWNMAYRDSSAGAGAIDTTLHPNNNSGGYYSQCTFTTKSAVNLTGRRTLKAYFTGLSYHSDAGSRPKACGVAIGICSKTSSGTFTNFEYETHFTAFTHCSNTGTQTVVFDLSNYQYATYIKIFYGWQVGDCRKVWLE